MTLLWTQLQSKPFAACPMHVCNIQQVLILVSGVSPRLEGWSYSFLLVRDGARAPPHHEERFASIRNDANGYFPAASLISLGVAP
jgi:hypothetical protein